MKSIFVKRKTQQQGDPMEEWLGFTVLALVAWWFYKSGKRIGSRKGYNVGRSRARRRK
jgi:hypothetical protein